jgi:hypothetical protein
MLQLKNQSPLAATMCLMPDRDGVDALFVVAKATFDLWPALKLADRQVPPFLMDEYWGAPGVSSLRYPSDLHVGKPATDVALVGRAWAPAGRRISECDVALRVAERCKFVRVFGDRFWRSDGHFTAPEPFESMPLMYERAFGGTHARDGRRVHADERNPVGTGLAGGRAPSEMTGEPLPNLEDPARLLTEPTGPSQPAALGFVAASWLPRRGYAGTYDDAWQRFRAPYLPVDFDARFLNSASDGLVFDRFLRGGEPVVVDGACSRGRLAFALPHCKIGIDVKIAGHTRPAPTQLETVLIEPDENRLCLTWRAHVSCDRRALAVDEIAITLGSIESPAGGAS